MKLEAERDKRHPSSRTIDQEESGRTGTRTDRSSRNERTEELMESLQKCTADRLTVGDEKRNRLAKIIDNVRVGNNDEWKRSLLNEIVEELQLWGHSANSQKGECVNSSETTVGADHNLVPDIKVSHENDSHNVKVTKKSPVFELFANDERESQDSLSNLVARFKSGSNLDDLSDLNNEEVLHLLNLRRLKLRELESKLNRDYERAVLLRRLHIEDTTGISFTNFPFRGYDYSLVFGSCCENVIGYVPIPAGMVGPLTVNGQKYFIPLATTEGALVASTNRGCRALFESGGTRSKVYSDGMSRAPVIQTESAMEALEIKAVFENATFYNEIKKVFESTSRFAKLKKIESEPNGRLLFIRFEATTGDAMGMNMVSKAVNAALTYLKAAFPHIVILSLSGNYCVDKKASALNWIKGRGKSVLAEATISSSVVERVLKTNVDEIVRLGQAKLLIGSSMAVSIGGANAHAANVVAAIFVATGQDVAQLVSSSMCLTTLEKTRSGDLYISCNMRCLEVGVVGGGTLLPAQRACLKMMGCEGNTTVSGENVRRFSEVICSTVLAGELSLLAAQCSNDLVQSHLRLNRSTRSLQSLVSDTKLYDKSQKRMGSSLKNERNHLQSYPFLEMSLKKRSAADKVDKLEMNCSNIL